jgi:hypothetical protein
MDLEFHMFQADVIKLLHAYVRMTCNIIELTIIIIIIYFMLDVNPCICPFIVSVKDFIESKM